jgi:hypothetical protein
MLRLRMKRCYMLVGLISAFLVGVTAGPAAAQSSWFHLTSSARPTNLHSGVASDTVQEVEFASVGETVCLAAHTEASEEEAACFTGEETAASMEATLRSTVFPERELSVEREETGGGSRYLITFHGQDVPPMASAPSIEEFEFGAGTPITRLSRGGPDGLMVITVSNLGDATAAGESEPLSIADVLPSNVEAVSMEVLSGGQGGRNLGSVACEIASLKCTFKHKLPPYNEIEVRIGVVLNTSVKSGAENEVRASGAGTTAAHIRQPLSISAAPTPFGAQTFEFEPEEEGGAADTQAASHPFQLTTTFTLNQTASKFTPTLEQEAEPAEQPKDLRFKIPAGLIGDPQATPSCPLAQFAKSACSPTTVIGVALVTYNEPRAIGINIKPAPVYNIEPAVGEPARFGFLPTPETPVVFDASVRTGGDYGVNVSVSNVVQEIGLLSATVTLWGVPGDSRHDAQRGEECLSVARGRPGTCAPLNQAQPPAFLSLPTSCPGSPMQTSVEADTWLHPGTVMTLAPTQPLLTLDGCNRVAFSAGLTVTSDANSSSSPFGMAFDVHVPQAEAGGAGGLAQSDVRDLSFLLPDGVTVNPSSANGLQGCSLGEIGLESAEPAACPDGSKIGTVTIHSPLLPKALTGFAYLASPQNFSGLPQENPFSSLVAMYIVASDPTSGVLVKLATKVTLDSSGRITASIEDSPQLPFEDAEVSLFSGPDAPLSTPPRCGVYTTTGKLRPWSGNEEQAVSSTFSITSGPQGQPCPGATLPFGPSLAAGASTTRSGAFSTLKTTISRGDGQQALQSAAIHFPEGVSGVLTGVPLCPDAAANAGTCGAASQIGEDVVSAGLGTSPFVVTGGKVYLTETFEGAPFGLSIVTPAKAGPFDLQEGRPVVVRARIDVDPTSGALTVTTGNVPQIIEGIPLQVGRVTVTVNRPGFSFNPTDCEPKAITGSIRGSEGAVQPVSVAFQATNCALLGFSPKLSAVTSSKSSRLNGTSFTTKLVYPKSAFGTQANIALAKVDLPKQLPSRTTTLNKACLAAVFEADPAKCPNESIVGHARVVTPVLPVPLTGPAYFVSHGNEAFPSLTVLLRGYGVTIKLVGSTFIHKGITSTTFKTPPDVPFSEFELSLPKGRYSALGAFGNLCKSKLAMPTEFVGQNGARINTSTKIAVTGCPKPKKRAAAKGRKARRAHR